MTPSELFNLRTNLVRTFLIENGYDAILLSRVDNFAMATGGRRNYVNLAGDGGASSLLVRREGNPVLVANEIEAPRMIEEELAGFDCDALIFPWFKSSAAQEVAKAYKGTTVSDDGQLGRNVHADLMPLRAMLSETELERYRTYGELAAFAMQSALDAIERGQTEAEIGAALVAAGTGCGFHVPVYLIAADERIAKHRHPLPTHTQKAKRYVMLVGGFQRDGLNVSMTRFKRFEELNADLLDAYERICCVDAAVQEATQPGRMLGEVFGDCQRAYAKFGFDANEWHKHHQGGATGYGARTCKGAPGETYRVLDDTWTKNLKTHLGIDAAFGQAYAWNPSAPGVKSEDTFLVWPDGRREIITSTPELPALDLAPRLGHATEVFKSGMA